MTKGESCHPVGNSHTHSHEKVLLSSRSHNALKSGLDCSEKAVSFVASSQGAETGSASLGGERNTFHHSQFFSPMTKRLTIAPPVDNSTGNLLFLVADGRVVTNN